MGFHVPSGGTATASSAPWHSLIAYSSDEQLSLEPRETLGHDQGDWARPMENGAPDDDSHAATATPWADDHDHDHDLHPQIHDDDYDDIKRASMSQLSSISSRYTSSLATEEASVTAVLRASRERAAQTVVFPCKAMKGMKPSRYCMYVPAHSSTFCPH